MLRWCGLRRPIDVSEVAGIRIFDGLRRKTLIKKSQIFNDSIGIECIVVRIPAVNEVKDAERPTFFWIYIRLPCWLF